MRPDDSRPTSPAVPPRQVLRPVGDRPREASNQAAASLVRNQINTIYDTSPDSTNSTGSSRQTLTSTNPYERTHTATHAQAQPTTDQWAKYHSAWQEYYQKYYERYYVGQVYQARQALASKVAASVTQPVATTQPDPQSETVSRDEALYDLRNKLRSNVQSSARKIRKSRHFIPIAAAACVILLFLFLQYNRVLFANVQAYISPGNIDPANIIVDPTSNLSVSPDPKLIIPKINVDVPVDYNTTPDYNAQMKAMENGVAWFGIPGAQSKPGQVGNTVLSGHSSNDIVDQGNYKFIFARLDHLSKGDTIYVNFETKRYTYTVTQTEVVKPTEVSKLVYPTDKPILTLITCTPLGTSLNRLLVTAEQVSPSPNQALKAPSSPSSSNPTSIPGNSPTFVQRIFGGGN